MVEPLGYPDFLGLARECAFLVSDSGGVQEEASIVKRPVLVVRRSTERPEVIGTFAHLVAPGPAIGARGAEWAQDVTRRHAGLADTPTPYGDGHAGERVAAVIGALVD
jgi:UDP-N-acetylglucosamine 2-epimerase (non-hydrolysing)